MEKSALPCSFCGLASGARVASMSPTALTDPCICQACVVLLFGIYADMQIDSTEPTLLATDADTEGETEPPVSLLDVHRLLSVDRARARPRGQNSNSAQPVDVTTAAAFLFLTRPRATKHEHSKNVLCSFCLAPQSAVQSMVAGPSTYICERCAAIAAATFVSLIARDATNSGVD